MSGRSLLWVNLECQVKEFLENAGQVVLGFDGWCAVRGNEVECTERRLCQVRRLALNHFNGHDAQTPDVNLAAVVFAGHNLWGHPVWSANHSSSLVLLLINLSTETEVS